MAPGCHSLLRVHQPRLGCRGEAPPEKRGHPPLTGAHPGHGVPLRARAVGSGGQRQGRRGAGAARAIGVTAIQVLVCVPAGGGKVRAGAASGQRASPTTPRAPGTYVVPDGPYFRRPSRVCWEK